MRSHPAESERKYILRLSVVSSFCENGKEVLMAFNEDRRVITKYIWCRREGQVRQYCQDRGENFPFLSILLSLD